MSKKEYRLKVNRIPNDEDPIYKKPRFPSFGELHLDLLENKIKVRKGAPKPVFVRAPRSPSPSRDHSRHGSRRDSDSDSERSDDDFTLAELEKQYNKGHHSDSDSDSDSDSHHTKESEKDDRGNYRQQHFQEQQEEEEDAEEREQREKSDLLFKLMTLRRKYPNVQVPEFTEHSDYTTMKRFYDQTIRRVALDSNIENYQRYLQGGFFVMEWVSTNWLGLDMTGFAMSQAKTMNSYERLLIELGEKNYSTAESRFPVEVRLIFLVLFNAGIFYVQKMIFTGGAGGNAGGGNSGGGLFGSLFGGMGQPQSQQAPQPQMPQQASMFGAGQQSPPGPGQAPPPVRRRRPMRGPTISPQEVEEFTKGKAVPSSMSGSDSEWVKENFIFHNKNIKLILGSELYKT